MATISNATLTISHDHDKKTARVIAKCRVNFTSYEQAQMNQGLQFKLKCKLWGADSGFNGEDDDLYTLSPAKYFPDATPGPSETVTYDVTLGEDVLDEDNGVDDIYARFTLINLYTLWPVTKKTNEIHHSF